MAARPAEPAFEADVCLILEGTYPYVAGGVSTWTHDLIRAQEDLSFYLVSLLPNHERREPRYEVPGNVVGIEHAYIQEMAPGARRVPRMEELFGMLEAPLTRIQSETGGLRELGEILGRLAPVRDRLGGRILLNSPPAWRMLLRMYEHALPEASFLDYFWTWRALFGGLYSVLLSDLPAARVYHTVSTGYAGLLAARAVLETGRPAIVSEHGIYTNERRIEIAMADWLFESGEVDFTVGRASRDLKDLWMDTFACYSRACYGACRNIITLYEGNQQLQLADGAPPERLSIIPNGVDYTRYSALARPAHHPGAEGRAPVVGFIGRVVPIKDVKTFIRACAMVREEVFDVAVKIIGPYDEDEDYYEDCADMVAQLDLGDSVTFTGRMKLDDVLGQIDILVLTSISEGMPLVILEGGAAGIPTVATNVGACRELIMGRSDEAPALGPGGVVTPLSNPRATAEACVRLLTEPDWYRRCSETIRARVERLYDKVDQDRQYLALYEECLALPTRTAQAPAPAARAAE